MIRKPRQTTLGVAFLFAVSLALTGCPRTPAVVPGAAASAAGGLPSVSGTAGGGVAAGPTAASRASGASAATGQRGVVATGTTIPAVPSPREFAETSALKDIHFDFDRSAIRPGDARILDGDVAWLTANARALVLIEGHCDERGTNEYNLALGERRATATRAYMVSHGIAASRISTISYGEERPLCTEHTEACWAKNRRAHMLVKP